MLKLKEAGKPPENMTGNMAHAKGSATPSDAVGRDGGAMPKMISDKIETTSVAKASLTKAMP